jgi:hypothetical protein
MLLTTIDFLDNRKTKPTLKLPKLFAQKLIFKNMFLLFSNIKTIITFLGSLVPLKVKMEKLLFIKLTCPTSQTIPVFK